MCHSLSLDLVPVLIAKMNSKQLSEAVTLALEKIISTGAAWGLKKEKSQEGDTWVQVFAQTK